MWPYASTKLRPEFEAKIENIQPEHLDEVEITQTLQAKMVVQRKLPSGETKEEIQKMMYGQKRKRNDARSHTKCNVRLPFLFLCLLAKYPYFAMVDKRRVAVHEHQEDMNKEVDKRRVAVHEHQEDMNKEVDKRRVAVHEHQEDMNKEVDKRRVAVHGHQEDMNKEGGKDVLLLSTTWPHVPIAKATLQASYGSKIVGGMPLGSECYEVFVYDVLKAEAPLLRPPGMKMAKALKSFIAWPRAQIQWCNNGDPVKPGLRSHPG
uniref:Transposase Tnp1/En/Spm-like domain-containing protein n=1 Tax=Oryza brachyantha TaxID=4533 RepID=J3L8H4_ORYBR